MSACYLCDSAGSPQEVRTLQHRFSVSVSHPHHNQALIINSMFLYLCIQTQRLQTPRKYCPHTPRSSAESKHHNILYSKIFTSLMMLSSKELTRAFLHVSTVCWRLLHNTDKPVQNLSYTLKTNSNSSKRLRKSNSESVNRQHKPSHTESCLLKHLCYIFNRTCFSFPVMCESVTDQEVMTHLLSRPVVLSEPDHPIQTQERGESLQTQTQTHVTSALKHSRKHFTETDRPQELTKHKSHKITYKTCVLENKSCPNLMHAKASRNAIALRDRKPEKKLTSPSLFFLQYIYIYNAMKFQQMTWISIFRKTESFWSQWS